MSYAYRHASTVVRKRTFHLHIMYGRMCTLVANVLHLSFALQYVHICYTDTVHTYVHVFAYVHMYITTYLGVVLISFSGKM